METILRKSRGFTLIELMVVMTILSVLAGIVVPAVTGTTTVGRGTALMSDTVTVQQAVDRFAGDNPTGVEKGWPTAGGTLPSITAGGSVPLDWGSSFKDTKTGETRVFLIHYLRGSVTHSGATRDKDISTLEVIKPTDVNTTTHGVLTDGNVAVTLTSLTGEPVREASLNSLWPDTGANLAKDVTTAGSEAYPVWRINKHGKVLVVMSDGEY